MKALAKALGSGLAMCPMTTSSFVLSMIEKLKSTPRT